MAIWDDKPLGRVTAPESENREVLTTLATLL